MHSAHYDNQTKQRVDIDRTAAAHGSCNCLTEGVDKMEGSLRSGDPWGVYTSTANRTDGRPTRQYDLFTQPLQYQCLYFSRHICYCLILKKKVAEQRIMKSKPNTHSQQAPGKKHTVSILISKTESRNMASVTHHLPSLLSFCGVEKDGEEVVLVGVKRGKLLEIEDMDQKGQRTLGFSRNTLFLLATRIWNICNDNEKEKFNFKNIFKWDRELTTGELDKY